MSTMVMIDCESLGTRYGDTILSIGAVVFNRYSGAILREFYVKIDPVKSRDAGFGYEQSTKDWWSQQSEEARKEAFSGTLSPLEAITQLTRFLPIPCNIWCCGGSFDFSLLKGYYDKLGIQQPWQFWRENCARTVYNLAPDIRKNTPFRGTAHNALDDSRHQVEVLVKTLKFLKL